MDEKREENKQGKRKGQEREGMRGGILPQGDEKEERYEERKKK